MYCLLGVNGRLINQVAGLQTRVIPNVPFMNNHIVPPEGDHICAMTRIATDIALQLETQTQLLLQLAISVFGLFHCHKYHMTAVKLQFTSFITSNQKPTKLRCHQPM
jgi:hypothetical protein